ncbi:hypothetical protein ACG83_34870 [Frankia sp. R43]|uniref:hypothetical protein n=1 Tax=Frankia sp. R43 TaxID=269536 RepID=UPI0006CA2829|nr:hypothetical protein [Frankia sp. R43]KPM51323.1 hypothetical protein ACG83_34870 [Frankia sp. R43]
MPYLNVVSAENEAGTLYHVPEWLNRLIDLPDAARQALVDDPTLTRVEILSDVYALEETFIRE